MRKIRQTLLILLIGNIGFAQNDPPGLSLIKTEDLKKDLYEFASAHFKGRSAGTLDELNAAMWLGEKFRSIGLQPAGDDGSYFQYFNLWRNLVSDRSTILINEKPFTLWKDVSIAQMANVNIHDTIFYLGNVKSIDTNNINVRGKVVALEANSDGINLNVSLPSWRYNRYIYNLYGLPILRRGAKAIIFIADETAELAWNDATENFKRGTYDIDGGPNENLTTAIPVLWLHQSEKNKLQGNNAVINATIIISKYAYPSVNVVGIIPGKDPKLKSEYVLYSGHIDAHGIRNEIKGDSIYYGADDNGSVDVAMLANARAFAKYPAKRSILFVIHGAEERGLLGSRYYSSHSTVPLSSITAVLNGDMIGRNNTDSAALLGILPPHRNSLDLVKMAIAANSEGPRFKLDTTWDNVHHIEGWYFRSDHVPYARLGIPAIMYSSLLHPDYHTPQDNAQNINYPKLKKMADWMYRTGWKVANASTRPGKDPNFKLER
jgi:Predicted aminopeptidases